MPTNVLGIDLTMSSKPSACVGLMPNGNVFCVRDFTDFASPFISELKEFDISLVAIDAPLGLPRGMCCLEESCSCYPTNGKGRQCEKELSKMGIGLYYTTKHSIIKEMVYRGIKLKGLLKSEGFDVIEIYPHATKVVLFGKNLPKKTTKEGLVKLRELIISILPSSIIINEFNHDFCDATLAAYTGLLFNQGKTISVGYEDESEIVIPIPQYMKVPLF